MSDDRRSIMLNRKKHIPARAFATVLGLGLVAIAASAVQATSTAGPLRCEIAATAAGGAIALESSVQTDVAVSGSYKFRVASAGHSGSANFQQGGGFSAAPGTPVTLGRIMLGNTGAIYDAILEIAADGATVTCTKRVGGNI
jgi:hypothetical protein